MLQPSAGRRVLASWRQHGAFSLVLSLPSQHCVPVAADVGVADALAHTTTPCATVDVAEPWHGHEPQAHSYVDDFDGDEAWSYIDAQPGDVIAGTYQVVALLGEGRSSRVYLVKSTHRARSSEDVADDAPNDEEMFAALKIFRCDETLTDSMYYESEMLMYLRDTVAAPFVSRICGEPLVHTTMLPLDGDGGGAAREVVYHCIACDVLGPSVESLMAEYAFKGIDNLHAVKQIVWSTSRSLEALASVWVMHADLKPENLLFVAPTDDVAALMGVPRGLSTSPLRDRRHSAKGGPIGSSQFNVKISDFGLSYIVPFELRGQNDPSNMTDADDAAQVECLIDMGAYERGAVVQTREYRSPEVIVGYDLSCAIDVWSLGCLVYELITGSLLFDPKLHPSASSEEHIDAIHLVEMIQVLGPPPASFFQGQRDGDGDRVSVFFRLQRRGGHVFCYDDDDVYNTRAELCTNVLDSIRAHLPEDESLLAADFIHACLQWDPSARATPKDLAAHAWLWNDYWSGD